MISTMWEKLGDRSHVQGSVLAVNTVIPGAGQKAEFMGSDTGKWVDVLVELGDSFCVACFLSEVRSELKLGEKLLEVWGERRKHETFIWEYGCH